MIDEDIKLLGYSIEVAIPDTNYAVIGFCNNELGCEDYTCNFLLKDKHTSQIIVMDDYEDIRLSKVHGEKRTLMTFIDTIVDSGEIVKYVSRMNYYDRCFCKGNTIIEQEG